MASKQLGKFRQWAGEVIAAKDKTVVTDEFRELEKDVALRKHGIDRLLTTSKAYHHSLAKKKDSEALTETDKFLPMDALGAVMVQHGEQFGEESAFGSSLVKFGRAHCKVATLQETYAITLEDTFLASLERSSDELRDYQSQRKKLESRRLAFDAAMSKAERAKTAKKDKDKEAAEEELIRARLRYEETSEDVRARMYSIQENEIRQLRDLSTFLDTELKFVEQYLDVLREVKADWIDEETIVHIDQNRPAGPSHSFRRALDSEAKSSSAIRTVKSVSSNLGHDREGDSDADDETTAARPSASHSPSQSFSKTHVRRKSDAAAAGSNSRSASIGRSISRPVSRNTTKDTMKRSSSVRGEKERGREDDEGEDSAKATEKRSRKLSMGMGLGMVGSSLGWASEKVSSVTGSVTAVGKGRFSSLRGRGYREDDNDHYDDDDDDRRSPPESTDEEEDDVPGRSHTPHSQVSRLTGRPNKGSPSLVSTSRANQSGGYFPPASGSSSVSGSSSSLPQVKWVRALYDFTSGSADDLRFRAGDEIRVVSEVSDGWCTGELNGRKALFPTSYTEPCVLPSSLSRRPSFPNQVSTTPKMSATRLPPDGESEADLSDVESMSMQPFGDHHLAASRSPLHGFFDQQSVLSDADSDADAAHTFSPRRNVFSDIPPTPLSADAFTENTGMLGNSKQPKPNSTFNSSTGSRSSVYTSQRGTTPRMDVRTSPSIASTSSSSFSGSASGLSSTPSGKKGPPPPPPARRSTNNVLAPPPLPSRPPLRPTRSSGGIPLPGMTTPPAATAGGETASPFE